MDKSGRTRLGVYALASGLGGAIPIPFLDTYVAGLARGAAVRRVALQHGVALSREARRALIVSADPVVRGAVPVRLARALVLRTVAPLRVVSRAEDALSTLAVTILFNHYLGRRENDSALLGEDEAVRVKKAMDTALLDGALTGLMNVPPRALAATIDAGGRAVAATSEDDERNTVERFVDGLLDALADAPGDFSQGLCERFDEAWARIQAEGVGGGAGGDFAKQPKRSGEL